MHVMLLGIPTPAAIQIYCDVGKRVELKSLKALHNSVWLCDRHIASGIAPFCDAQHIALGEVSLIC
jgi:hypothetical protein